MLRGDDGSDALAGSPTPTPSSWRDRRMSAWLRKRPATRRPRSKTTNVTTTPKATIAIPPRGVTPVFNRQGCPWSDYDGISRGRASDQPGLESQSSSDLEAPVALDGERRGRAASIVGPAHRTDNGDCLMTVL